MKQNLLKRLEEDKKKYSKTQRLIAEYISDNYDKAAFMTAGRLAKEARASESTVVRFAAELGYNGYQEMQQDLQELLKNKFTAIQRIELASDRMSGDIVESVLRSDVNNILETLDNIDRAEFEKAVECILNSEKIYITGVRAAAPLAQFLGFYLNIMFPNVHIISTISVSEVFEQLLRLSDKDVLIGISFPRYSRRTTSAMQFAHDRKANVIAITDSDNSPLCKFADYRITAKSGMVSFADSIVAPLSCINALIAALSMRMKNDVANSLSTLEEIWDDYGVYEKLDNE